MQITFKAYRIKANWPEMDKYFEWAVKPTWHELKQVVMLTELTNQNYSRSTSSQGSLRPLGIMG